MRRVIYVCDTLKLLFINLLFSNCHNSEITLYRHYLLALGVDKCY